MGDEVEKMDLVSKQNNNLEKSIPKDQSPEEMLSSGDHLQRPAHQLRPTIPSYGYVPNSVVRKKAQPPPSPCDIETNMWKYMTLEEVEEHWFKFDNFDDDTIWMPDVETSESESSRSEYEMPSSLKSHLSNYEILKRYYEDQDDESVTQDDNKISDEDKADNTYTIEFDDDNGPKKHIDAKKLINAMSVKDRQIYQKYFEQNRDRSSSVRVSFRKLGNTLLTDDTPVTMTTNQKKKGERVLKFRPMAKTTYAVKDYSNDDTYGQSDAAAMALSNRSSRSSTSSEKLDSDEVASTKNKIKSTARVEPQQRRRSSVSLYRTSSDLKAKLLQQRSEAKELAQFKTDISNHPLLQVRRELLVIAAIID